MPCENAVTLDVEIVEPYMEPPFTLTLLHEIVWDVIAPVVIV